MDEQKFGKQDWLSGALPAMTYVRLGQRHLMPAIVYVLGAAASVPVKAGPFGIPRSRCSGAGK